MSDAQAEKPVNEAVQSTAQSQPEVTSDSGNNEQKWQEALKWKQKAEEYNAVERRAIEAEQRLLELQRQQYNSGQTATDPQVELVRQLQEQAQFDPVAKATLWNMEQTARAQAEAWLSRQVADVPAAKRAQVEDYIRAKGYQVSAAEALRVMTDPDVKTLAEQLAATKQELERYKSAKPNGASPAFAAPSTASADDGKVQESIPRGEYLSILGRASVPGASDDDKEKARNLARAVAANRTRLEG